MLKRLEQLEDLLNLEQLVILDIMTGNDMVVILTAFKSDEAVCPKCGRKTRRLHQQELRFIRDLPCFGKTTILVIPSRRFRCDHCDNGDYVFTETLDFVDRYQRQTTRYQRYLARLCRNNTVEFAREFEGISWDAANRIFNRIADEEIEGRGPSAPEYLGLDDVARSKGHVYNTIVSDLGEGRVLEVIPGRTMKDLEGYLSSKSDEWKGKVKAVCIDMYKAYRSIVEKHLKNAAIVVDRFHIVALLHKAIDAVRRRLQRERKKEKREFFDIRGALHKDIEELTGEELQGIIRLYNTDEVFATCHELKEEFRTFLRLTEKEEMASFLDYWQARVEESGIPELKEFSKTLSRWREEILNYALYPITNGFVEGLNNKIQTIKRRGYGYRNEGNFRRRVLLECA